MIDSLISDIRGQMQHGNMVVRLIFANVFVFILMTLIGVFSYGGEGSDFYKSVFNFLALPGDLSTLGRKPWTIITHMFVHDGFGHIAWNMLFLYWFGRITGDLLGDKKIVPLYFVGGIVGGLFYLFFANVLHNYGGVAVGASAAVMGIIVAAGFLAPEYRINLLFLGPVKLMYIVAVLFIMDLAFINKGSNAGGHFAHIGGAVWGGFYIYYIQSRGIDLLAGMQSWFDDKPKAFTKRAQSQQPTGPAKIVVMQKPRKKIVAADASQEEIDRILDKITISGIQSLTSAEKDVLNKASKE